ncbi:MAG: FAD:protein FMN transferase, partial [Longimicrobiales bacterium]
MDLRNGNRPGREAEGISRRRALKITAVAGVGLALGGGLTRALLERARLHRIRRTRIQMGTEVTVTMVHSDPVDARRLVDATFDEIERLEAILSRYRPEAPVSRLARDGVLRNAPPELLEVLGRARDLSERTGGAFDVTVAPLLDLYRDRAAAGREDDPERGLPSEEEIGVALALVDYRLLRVEDGFVALERPGMGITLDGLAKGFIVDRAVATLAAGGARRVLVEAGGDLATSGAGPAGRGSGILQDGDSPDAFGDDCDVLTVTDSDDRPV